MQAEKGEAKEGRKKNKVDRGRKEREAETHKGEETEREGEGEARSHRKALLFGATGPRSASTAFVTRWAVRWGTLRPGPRFKKIPR